MDAAKDGVVERVYNITVMYSFEVIIYGLLWYHDVSPVDAQVPPNDHPRRWYQFRQSSGRSLY